MNPVPLNPAEVRDRIVSELQIGHLAREEQDQIVEALGEVLLERATYEVMRRIPESEFERLDQMTESGDDEGIQKVIRTHVPNVEEVVGQAVQDGIAEHKRLVAEEVQARIAREAGAPQAA
jgi:ATP phosphoribosyltransferase